jgi:hypothetical protein
MTDDRQILDDYVLWSTTKELDTSIDAFLAERKAEADAQKIAEAISQAGIYLFNWESDDNDVPHADDAYLAMKAIQSILIDDRPTVIEGPLTERRTYLT